MSETAMSLFLERPADLPRLPAGIPLTGEGFPAGLRTPNDGEAGHVFVISPESLSALARRFGATFSFASRGEAHVLFSDPADVVDILVNKASSFLKGNQEAAFAAAVGWGLLTAEGEMHKKSQATLGPALRGRVLDSYVASIVETSVEWISRIRDQKSVPLVRSIRQFTQAGSERSLFGRAVGSHDFRYQESVLVINAMVLERPRPEVTGEEFVSAIREFREHRDFVRDYVSVLVRSATNRPSASPTFLDYILGEATLEEQGFGHIHQQVSVFLQAAVETTASLLSWMLALLSSHPQHWQALIDEARQTGPDVDMATLKNLTLNQAVVSEALRLYPPAWMLPRVANEDVTVGQQKVARGTSVIVSPWVTHRNADLFFRAEEFRPERWLDETAILPRGAYYPFGLGNRTCIGERYGKITATIFLHQMLLLGLKASVTPDDLEVGQSALIANPRLDLKLSFTPMTAPGLPANDGFTARQSVDIGD
jgi:cytochrome P450